MQKFSAPAVLTFDLEKGGAQNIKLAHFYRRVFFLAEKYKEFWFAHLLINHIKV